MPNKEVEDVSITTQKRKGKTLIQNLNNKILDEYGNYPDEKMMVDELVKLDDKDFDKLLEE